MRGLVPAERLEAALAAVPATAREFLDELLAQGILDAEDLEILQGLARQGVSVAPSDGSAPDEEGLPTGAEVVAPPRSGGGSGRQILRQLSEPSWGPYRNLRFIGEGGMGRIFKAYDPVLKRTVALKLLRHEDPALVERFTLEAQHQARVEHPNIAKVFAVGEWEGQPYLAMQFIRGETLESLEAKLSLEAKVRVMEQVAEAVHAAHRQGLIHRDLKPANIMVERDGNSLVPFVLDFGLARGVESTGQTLQGAVMGTMHYMAPEQARGAQELIGRQTDVYGLGATLHRLLTGRPPFFEGQGLDVARLTLEEDLPSLHKLKPDLPEDLDLLVRKCMEKDPVNRYANALEVAEELHRWLSGEPLRVQKPSLGYLTSKWVRRHRLVVAVAATGVLALFAVVGISLKGRLDLRKQAAYAQYFGQEAERIEALVRYSHMLPAHDIRPDLARVRARMAGLEAEWRSGGKLAEGPAVYALGRVHLALGNAEAALASLDAAERAGFRAPEMHHARGRVMALLHRKKLLRLSLIRDPEVREREEQRLGEERAEILWRLRAGMQSSLEPMAYQEAHLALLEGSFPKACEKAREALVAASWLYDALALEAQAHMGRARRLEGEKERLEALESAGGALRRARDLAPSDPGLFLLESERLQVVLQLMLEHGRSMGAVVAELNRLHTAWAHLSPEDPAQLSQRALSEAMLALQAQGNGLGGDPGYWVKRAQASAQAALARQSDLSDAHLARLLALKTQLAQEQNAGGTPPIGLDEVFEAVQGAMASAPQDPWVLETVSSVFARSTATLPFEALPGLMGRIDALFPSGSLEAQVIGSFVQVELADRRFQEGQDPRPQVKRALELVEAIRRDSRWAQHRTGPGGMAWYVLAAYQDRLGEDPRKAIQAALQSFQSAIQTYPRYLTARWGALELRLLEAEWTLKAGDNPESALAEARTLHQGLLKTHPQLWVLPWAEAKALWIEAQGKDQTRMRKALELAGIAAKRNPSEVQIPMLRATILKDLGEPRSALRELEAYLQREPRRYWARQMRDQLSRGGPGG